MDPFSASSPVVANFLTEIAADRSLCFSTLAGYRSAISRVLLLTTGEDLGLCPVLNQLMKSFKRSQPVFSKRVPSWDFSVVLNYLGSVNNMLCDLKILTFKCIFLLALASGDRRSALAALSRSKIRVSSDAVVIPYNENFIPKSYFIKRNTTRIRELRLPFVRCQSSVGACPASAILIYNDRVDAHRDRSHDCLFVKHSNFDKVTANSISFYIKECIAAAYEAAGLSRVTGRAHDVRKIAAALRSLTNPALDDVLVAGDWSSPETFFKHYFFDINNEVLCSTGQSSNRVVVAGRKTVSF